MSTAQRTNTTAGNRAAGPQSTQAERFAALLMRLSKEVIVSDDDTTRLPMQQHRILLILHEGGRRTMSEIGQIMEASLSSLTQMADRLERAGLVERVPVSGDRRARALTLTPRGAHLMRRRKVKREQRAASILRQLTPGQRETLLQALQTAIAAVLPSVSDETPRAEVLSAEGSL